MRLPTGVGRALAFDRAALAPGRAIRAALGVGLPLVIGAAHEVAEVPRLRVVGSAHGALIVRCGLFVSLAT